VKWLDTEKQQGEIMTEQQALAVVAATTRMELDQAGLTPPEIRALYSASVL